MSKRDDVETDPERPYVLVQTKLHNKGSGSVFECLAWSACLSPHSSMKDTTHVLVSPSFLFIFESDDGTLSLTTILILLASSLDPVDLGL